MLKVSFNLKHLVKSEKSAELGAQGCAPVCVSCRKQLEQTSFLLDTFLLRSKEKYHLKKVSAEKHVLVYRNARTFRPKGEVI